MKERIPLKPNTKLIFKNQAGGSMPFFIRSVVGQGGSCLVYDGYYENNAGGKSTVRIKECYPYMLSMERNSQGGLMITQKSQRKQFELYKKRFRDSFVVISELHEMAGLTKCPFLSYS